MLTEAMDLGERVASGPSAVWHHHQLWLGYRSATNELVLRKVSVLNRTPTTTRYATTFQCSEHVALASIGDTLFIVFKDTSGTSFLTSTTNGATFDAPRALNVGVNFFGSSACAATRSGFALVWGENDGGKTHVSEFSNLGNLISDQILPPMFQAWPALAFDAANGRALIAGADRETGNLLTYMIDPTSSWSILATTKIPDIQKVYSVGACHNSYHNNPGFHLIVQIASQTSSSGIAKAFSTLDSNGNFGKPEVTAEVTSGLSVAWDGLRAWVAWTRDNSELVVAPYVTTFDLPKNLLDLLGQECSPTSCPPDPRITCAASDRHEWRYVPARIENADKGDIILSPGDGDGLIGTLMEQLDPRQYYDHMGIMVRDKDMVRHATMAHSRVESRDPGHFMTGTFFDKPAPVDGFRPDVVKYGWPGTITQSVEDASRTGFNTWNPLTNSPWNKQGDFFRLNPGVSRLAWPGADATPEAREAWEKQNFFADPEYPSETYRISNLPLGPAYRASDSTLVEPLVIKPNPSLEALDPLIRQSLHRVADAATEIDGHYRFYSYTDARIALDPAKAGPPSGHSEWSGLPSGADWSAGTIPVVCSSFVWAAIQYASRSVPTLEVEGQTTESPDEQLPTPLQDGLYRYSVAERKKSGQAFHELLSNRVKKDVYLEIQKAEHENRLILDLAKIGLSGLLLLLQGPLGVLAAILGLDLDNVAKLKLMFEDMPDDLATQMCNAFSHDRPDERDVDLWAEDKEGIAVSPDDIWRFWDPPKALDRERKKRHGLWGHSEKLRLAVGRYEPKRIHIYERSKGLANVKGRVFFKGEALIGAKIEIGCEKTLTKPHHDFGPFFEMDIAAGRYEIEASHYWPATDEILKGKLLVELMPGEQLDAANSELIFDIKLEEPASWRRLMRCTGKIDVVRKVLIGENDHANSTINMYEYLTYAPNTWGNPPPEANNTRWVTHFSCGHAQRFSVWGEITVELQDNLSVNVWAKSMLCEHFYEGNRPTGEQIINSQDHQMETIQPDQFINLTFDHNSGNFPPDRGHVEIKIENLRAPV